ncbi:MAG TPA: tetratricopeptide repeat protein [Steroidobacteraceae bacterium]|nr:tetratricopeptide repeat protein [Steroidobacteraceae bacterium]
MDRATHFVGVLICGLFLAATHTTSGQEFDYDPARPAALRACDDLRNHGRTPDARACYERLLSSSSDDAIQAEAAWAIGDVRRANDLFRAVVQADDKAVRPKVRWGRLYLDTHQYGDASGLFREALDVAPDDVYAKLAVARLMSETFDGDARKLVAQIIDKGGDKVLEAHLLSARMDLDDGHYRAAERSLQRAVDLAAEQKQPPLEAYELLAALDLLRGDTQSKRWIDKALAYNPHYGGVYETLAHYEVMRRRYAEANDWLKRAVEVQPERWSAQAELGVNLLRLGDIDGSQAALQRAYSGDPFSATTVNTLRVLDKLKDFAVERATSPDIVMRLDRKEADALRPYVEKVARESIATFSRRYSFAPQQAVNIELYPNHDDFAVRTAGLPGIGLLGVTFGYLVAMDSPSGRSTGDFHWGSTLWHEMAHVFTLSITDHRVPRWLSEGISVFEEWRTGPTPGIAVTPRALDVFHDGKFLPVATLDEGFIRPDYADQVQVSYMQSGLICYFIEQRWGFDKLVALLRQFTKETTTAEAVEATFKMSPPDFDKELAKFLNERFAKYLADPKAWQQAMQTAHKAAGESKWADVIEPARRAVDLFPDYTLSGSPWLLLARAYDETGKRGDALGALQRYRELGGWDPDALRKLATWLDEAKQPQKSLEVLNALTLVAPLDASLHAQLGERYNAAGKAADSLREYKVLLALDAHDNAAANFGIARALNSLGDRAQSRRYVLEALETAPHYRPAQDLLLEITGKPTQ